MTKGQTREFYNNMSSQDYVLAMGGATTGNADRESGIAQPYNSVYRYLDKLRDYACNRYIWQSDILNPYCLQLIEWLFFHTGKACLIYPSFYSKKNPKKTIRLKKPFIFNANILTQNQRTSEPLRVNIIDSHINALSMPLKRDYLFTDFAMLSCNYTHFNHNNVPLFHTAWEFANKLYELDLTFIANATKQRIPILLNNGVRDARKEKQQYNSGNFTTGDLVRAAMERNEQFLEIPQSQVGDNGILHNTNQYSENNLLDYITTQRRLFDEFFEIIGIEVMNEKHGVYQAKSVQELSLGNNNYKTVIALKNRRFFANLANKKFNLDLQVKVLEYL